MKRLFFLYFLVIVLLFTGCYGQKNDTWQPSRASSEIAPYARRAIEIIDGYLNFEISSEEASESFKELDERIEPYGIRETDSEYSDPDKEIAFCITMLAIGQAEYRTDIEYHQYRDILAFQIGEPVSGKIYAAEQSVFDLDEDGQEAKWLNELIDITSVPFDYSHVIIADDDISHGLMFFDEQYGVQVSDLQQYLEMFYGNLVEKNLNNISFTFHYSRYKQDVLSISLSFLDGEFTGTVYRDGEAVTEARNRFIDKYSEEERIEMTEYPKEFAILNPLYEFHTIEDLPNAIAAASAFSGSKITVPDRNDTKTDETQEKVVATEEVAAEETEIIINDYPDAIGSDEEKLLTPLLPDEVFTSTAEENGLEGTVYKIYGTVTEITADENGNINFIYLHTYMGDIVIQNIIFSMVDDQGFSELGKLDSDVINSLCPIPQKGEFCRIFAEYQGFSGKYNAPYFIYGSQDYMLTVVLEALC